MDKDINKQKMRIAKVFPKGIEDISKSTGTLEIYREFLKRKLDNPINITGIEDFDWEEFYILGPGSQKEYEKLKKTRPSYTDKYILESIDNEYDEHFGLIANVIRECDKKVFQIPLADLKALDKNTKNYQLLDDYSVWCVNY
jgi:hypothetical protein